MENGTAVILETETMERKTNEKFVEINFEIHEIEQS